MSDELKARPRQLNRWGWFLDTFDLREIEMKKTEVVLVLIVVCLSVSAAAAQINAQNGDVVEQSECWKDPFTSYEQYVAAMKARYTRETEAARTEGFERDYMTDIAKRLYSKEEFAQRNAFAGFECKRLKYMSDGLKVVGIIWKPKDTAGKKLPLVIYNRGGNREFSKLRFINSYSLYPFLQNGFVVIGTQYRGNDGGEGKDEFGGADINDVMNLIPLAKSLGYVDMNNVFMFGESRGGMETYLALKNKIPVNAAAVGGAVSDLTPQKRSNMEKNFKEMIPDYETRSAELLKERSAVYWADKINTPVLILQGGADWRTDPASVLSLAQKLQELGKTYELTVYAGDEHGLSLNRAEADRRTIEWFKKYMK
jgi:dipeptidyl aminopeptidase/acylaminoacyl peptidase